MYEYTSTPSNTAKLGTTLSNIQTAQSCPSIVENALVSNFSVITLVYDDTINIPGIRYLVISNLLIVIG